MRAPVTHPGGRTGLIGTVLCIGVLAIVARLSAPDRSQATQIVEGNRLASAVDAVRSVIGSHRMTTLARTSPTGWPIAINPEWFPGAVLPTHPDTGQPFTVEIVDGRSDERFPAIRTFDIRDLGARTLWYNRTNGAVCARVVDDGNAASAKERFERANGR